MAKKKGKQRKQGVSHSGKALFISMVKVEDGAVFRPLLSEGPIRPHRRSDEDAGETILAPPNMYYLTLSLTKAQVRPLDLQPTLQNHNI